jgi:hypothetical protein
MNIARKKGTTELSLHNEIVSKKGGFTWSEDTVPVLLRRVQLSHVSEQDVFYLKVQESSKELGGCGGCN